MVAAHDSEPEATHGTTSAFTTPDTQQQDNTRNNDHTMNMDQQAQTNMMIQQLTNIMQTMMTREMTRDRGNPAMQVLNERLDLMNQRMSAMGDNITETMSMGSSNPIMTLTENQVHKTTNQRLGKNKYAGAMPGNKVEGPILFQWEMEMTAVLKVLNLYPAIMGDDLDERAQSLSAYAIMQGLDADLITRISAQPRLTNSGVDLWNYLQATYAPKGISGMIYALTALKDATPEKPLTPDSVRKYIDNLRVLWMFNERQICPTVTWGVKLEMIFRALDAPWACQYKFHLVRRLQDQVAAMELTTEADQAMATDDGEALVGATIAEILDYLATVDVSDTPAGLPEVHYTSRGKGKGKGKGKGGRRMLDAERDRIREYYRNETTEQAERRRANRANDTCGACGQTGHWRMDPECPGATDRSTTEAHVTEVMDF
jgi:hypothetical protein